MCKFRSARCYFSSFCGRGTMSLRCFFLFGVLFSTTLAQNTCATFEFSTINGSTLTAAENTTVSFPFAVKHAQNCEKRDKFSLQVSRITKLSHIQCSIVQENGSCYYPVQTSKCECTEQPGHYRLTHKIDRSDRGVWLWSSDYRDIQTTTVNFTVLYPPRVTRLTITQNGSDVKLHPAEESSTVDVDCEWEDGNPTSNVSLLDRHGKQIARGGYSDGHLRRNIHDVRCEDAGSIQCVGPSATENKTATLLVKCAPKLSHSSLNDIIVIAGSDSEIRFPMRTHTAEIQECWMRRDAKTTHGNTTERNCTRSATVTGTPPDLVLTVRLDNVRKEDEGQWTLTLTNDAGEGHLDVHLKVVEVTGKGTPTTSLSTQRPTSKGKSLGNNRQLPEYLASWMTAGAAAVVTVTVVVFVMCRLCRKDRGFKTSSALDRCEAERQENSSEVQLGMKACSRLAQSEECVMIHNVLYQPSRSLPEIPDSIYEDVRANGAGRFMDIDNRPPAPLPPDSEEEDVVESSDYADVDDVADEVEDDQLGATSIDYVPINQILERKKQTQLQGTSRTLEEGDVKEESPVADSPPPK